MARPRLDEPWTWTVLAVECPMCGQTTRPEAADLHAGWHWLTQTETEEIAGSDSTGRGARSRG